MSLQFVAKLTPIFSGAQGSLTSRWTADNFIDKVLAANPSIPPVYWPGSGMARVIPGLPLDEAWDGVSVVAGHAVLWKGSVLKHSALNDFALWIPVAVTAASGRATLVGSFSQPATGTETDWVYLTGVSGSFVVGQYVRIVSNESDPALIAYDYYIVEAVALSKTSLSDTISLTQTVSAGDTQKIFLTTDVAWPDGVRLSVDGEDAELVVVNSSRNGAQFEGATGAVSTSVPAVGGLLSLPLTDFPVGLRQGDLISIGDHADVGLDIYEVEELAQTLQVRRLGEGSEQAAEGVTYPTGTFVRFQPWVEVENDGATDVEIPDESSVSVRDALKITPQGLSGATAATLEIPAGAVVETVDANEAGEILNVGSKINGDIFHVPSLGEYGYILKERSIQSIQYVGINNGTFFIRPEVQDEGPISKSAWSFAGENSIVFWGHKEFYLYSGGQTLLPVAGEHSQQVFDELDQSRVDEIVTYHDEAGSKVWFVYPLPGTEARRVLIFNYKEQTSVIDDYDASLNGLTAIGGIDWEVAPTWESLDIGELWDSQDKRWNEFVDEGLKRQTILAIGGDEANPLLGDIPDTIVPRLLLHGRVFSRLSREDCGPGAYTCLAETPDFDAGDAATWKYVDTIQLGVHVVERLARSLYLKVQVGSRDNLDSDIRWSAPSRIDISGNANPVTKVNIRASGRYIRLRFFSDQSDARWKITFYRIIFREGGTY